jgi:transcriptional regulatory protein LevR
MVYHDLCKEMNEQRYDHNSRNSVIITLCHTGAEGAKYLKDYIDQHSRLGIKTIALNISGRKILLKEAMELKRSYHIHAFVGTYDPKLLGIPYIPASKLLNAEPQNVDRTLLFEPVRLPSVDYSRVYGYLQEQLKFASVAKLKHVLPNVVDEMMVMYDLDSDQMQGIFIHLACVVEQLLSGGKTNPNPQAQQIIEALPDDCRAVVKILRPLERAFKIIIDDNEIATLLMMLKKI